MQRALPALVAIGLVPTTRTGMLFGVATAVKNLWRWEILRACDPFRGIGSVDAGSCHTWVLHSNKGGIINIRRKVPACPHETRFLYYSVEIGAIWGLGRRVIGVLHGLSPSDLVAQDGTPALLKRIDLVELNNIGMYFEQLKRRIPNVGDRDD